MKLAPGIRRFRGLSRIGSFPKVLAALALDASHRDQRCGMRLDEMAYPHSFTCICRDANQLILGWSSVLVFLPPDLAVCLRVGAWGKTWDNAENFSAT